MSTHVPGAQSFFKVFLHHFVLAKLPTSSIRVKLSAPFSISLFHKEFNALEEGTDCLIAEEDNIPFIPVAHKRGLFSFIISK